LALKIHSFLTDAGGKGITYRFGRSAKKEKPGVGTGF
jgi:hypothetical protein